LFNKVKNSSLGDFGEIGKTKYDKLGNVLNQAEAVAIWTRLDKDGRPDPVVIAGPAYGGLFGKPEITTAHETLHIQFKMNHVELANKLGIGEFSNEKQASDALNK
jgi:hypothetical protein